MKNKVYYCFSKLNNLASVKLPNNLEKHVYKAESVFAWSLLVSKYKQVFNQELPAVLFLDSGKPIIENGYISISHSNGYVAVCFSKTAETGIDIELIKNTVPLKTAEYLGVKNPPDFYKKWTERESVIKAKNYSALKKGAECEFIGLTQTILVKDNAFSLSVYGENAEFIKV